jgi:transporter family-2 protein
MSGFQQTIYYALAMLAVGLGIPMFAALNGGLATRLQNPMLASTVALLAALGIVASTLLLTQGLSTLKFDASIPLRFYLGGVFVAIYILGMTWVAPRFGVGNAIAFVLLGQLISMSLIDHFAWFGAAHHQITAQRALGLALMTVGVFLSVRR